jgi:hypothetical protein
MRENNVHDLDKLRHEINLEKEMLVSMFLANASQSQLASQYKRIDELNEKIMKGNGRIH